MDEPERQSNVDPDVAATTQLAEGLRERKKRLTRQLLSDTATAMFLEHGFDGFKVSEVAEACGVSEKTVYNYFPTKESLILDREEYVAESIRQALGPDNEEFSPVEAIVNVLAQERTEYRTGFAEIGDEMGLRLFRRFVEILAETPSLRAAQKEASDRLARVAAEALAARASISPDDPEPTIAAHALIGLWGVQQQALRREDPEDKSVDDVYQRAGEEVHRAARLIDTGLWSFSALVSGSSTREQLRTAAENMQGAARQVAAALRQARRIWVEHAQAEVEWHAADAESAEGQWHAGGAEGAEGCAGHGHEWYSDQPWRELQRETVQRWREAQRAHQQEWREAKQRMKQELRDELREARRVRREESSRARRRPE